MSKLPIDIRHEIETIFDVALSLENIEDSVKWGLEIQGINANIETVLAFACGVVNRAVIHISEKLHDGNPSKEDLKNALPVIRRRIDELRDKLMKERIVPMK